MENKTSGLYREKWDKRHGKDTYGGLTIAKAIADCKEVYTPQTRTTAQQDFAPAQQTAPVSPSEWEPPIPFETVNTPDFPIESLPAPVAAFVEMLAESTQTPEEMAALLSLGVLATAFQSRYVVEVNSDWKEQLSLYPVAIALPGERKSAVLAALSRPVYDYEADRRKLESVDIAQNQQEKRMLEKALANAEAAATKTFAASKKKTGETASQEQAKQKALGLAEELATFEELHPYRLLVDDTTPEKLVDIMDMQGGCITVASAEGGVFDAISGRYDKGAGFDVYLKGHAGDVITVDRIGRKSNHIPNPRLTMMLTIQPEVLNGLMSNATFRGRGLCGRFLYVMCKSKVGHRKSTPEPITPQVKEEYRQFVWRILSGTDTGTIYLSTEAQQLCTEYRETVEKRLINEWEHMADWGNKLVGATVRIAALIHASEVRSNPTDTEISPEVMTAAIKIGEVLGVHAMVAYQIMGADEVYEDAKYLWRRIRSTGQDKISKRDLIRLCHGKFPKAETMEPALEILIEMNYIKRVFAKTNGKPSETIFVNPSD